MSDIDEEDIKALRAHLFARSAHSIDFDRLDALRKGWLRHRDEMKAEQSSCGKRGDRDGAARDDEKVKRLGSAPARMQPNRDRNP